MMQSVVKIVYVLSLGLVFSRMVGAGPAPYNVQQVFPNYQELFRYIAHYELSPEEITDDLLFTLAVESSVERYRLQTQPDVWGIVIEADMRYPDTQLSRIRGAQGNGRYYVVIPTHGQFRLVGVLEGNSYTTEWVHGRFQFLTTWHLSGEESGTMLYEWNGTELVMLPSE